MKSHASRPSRLGLDLDADSKAFLRSPLFVTTNPAMTKRERLFRGFASVGLREVAPTDLWP
jgi:hypothetical protein